MSTVNLSGAGVRTTGQVTADTTPVLIPVPVGSRGIIRITNTSGASVYNGDSTVDATGWEIPDGATVAIGYATQGEYLYAAAPTVVSYRVECGG